MVALAKSINNDIFANTGDVLPMDYISKGLFLFGKDHTEKRLIETLCQMEVCGLLTSTNEGYKKTIN